MKTLILVSSLILSFGALADSLHCKGMDTRLEIHGADVDYGDEDQAARVLVWSRDYEKAKYADLFDGFSDRATAKQLMAKKVIKAESMKGKFKLDLNNSTLVVTRFGNTIKDKVICEYQK